MIRYPATKCNRPLARVGYKNVPDSKTDVLRTNPQEVSPSALGFECEARHGGTRPAREMNCCCPNLVAENSVRELKTPGKERQPSFRRDKSPLGASERRLFFPDGGLKPPVKDSNEIWTATIYFAFFRLKGLFKSIGLLFVSNPRSKRANFLADQQRNRANRRTYKLCSHREVGSSRKNASPVLQREEQGAGQAHLNC